MADRFLGPNEHNYRSRWSRKFFRQTLTATLPPGKKSITCDDLDPVEYQDWYHYVITCEKGKRFLATKEGYSESDGWFILHHSIFLDLVDKDPGFDSISFWLNREVDISFKDGCLMADGELLVKFPFHNGGVGVVMKVSDVTIRDFNVYRDGKLIVRYALGSGQYNSLAGCYL